MNPCLKIFLAIICLFAIGYSDTTSYSYTGSYYFDKGLVLNKMEFMQDTTPSFDSSMIEALNAFLKKVLVQKKGVQCKSNLYFKVIAGCISGLDSIECLNSTTDNELKINTIALSGKDRITGFTTCCRITIDLLYSPEKVIEWKGTKKQKI